MTAKSVVIGPARVVKVPVWARARQYTEEALLAYVRALRDPDASHPVRMLAADRILDRGWGKAPIIVMGEEDRAMKLDVSALPPETMATIEAGLLAMMGASIAATIEHAADSGGDGVVVAPAARGGESAAADAGVGDGPQSHPASRGDGDGASADDASDGDG